MSLGRKDGFNASYEDNSHTTGKKYCCYVLRCSYNPFTTAVPCLGDKPPIIRVIFPHKGTAVCSKRHTGCISNLWALGPGYKKQEKHENRGINLPLLKSLLLIGWVNKKYCCGIDSISMMRACCTTQSSVGTPKLNATW